MKKIGKMEETLEVLGLDIERDHVGKEHFGFGGRNHQLPQYHFN